MPRPSRFWSARWPSWPEGIQRARRCCSSDSPRSARQSSVVGSAGFLIPRPGGAPSRRGWAGFFSSVRRIEAPRSVFRGPSQRSPAGPRLRLRNPTGGGYVSAMLTLRTVLFDLDGTLIDSVRLILDSYHHTLAAHGLPPRSDEHWLSGVGTPLTVQLADWGHDPDTLNAMIATYRKYNLANHDRMVTVYPGVVAAVEAIRAAGLRT